MIVIFFLHYSSNHSMMKIMAPSFSKVKTSYILYFSVYESGPRTCPKGVYGVLRCEMLGQMSSGMSVAPRLSTLVRM